MDLRDVDGGNPGIGGTEYMFFLIARYLSLKGRVAMYITRQGLFPDGIEYHVVGSLDEALDRFDENGESIVVLRESEVLPNIKRLGSIQQKILVWAHNYSGHKTLKACVRCPNIVRFICVSREQYENLRDEAIFSKADYIYNAAAVGHTPLPSREAKGNEVFYMGSIIEPKGFHVLAKQWPEIRRAVPDARLHIVGSGQLYSREESMGPLGIAAPAYEKEFAKYLAAEDGRLREDVVFHGTMGAEKNEVLSQAKVAVANPTGKGETFCISALEFELLGVPVVTKNVGGPKNVVKNGVCGILYEREGQLAKAVIRLLTDEPLRLSMSNQAAAYARATFDVEIVIQKWERLIEDVEEGIEVVPDYLMTSGDDGIKHFKEMNRRIKKILIFRWLPSIDFCLHALQKKKNSLFVKPFKRVMARLA